VGFGCLGEDARVPGLPVAADVVDVGVGRRPDLVGRGTGADFATAFLDFAASRTTAARFRVVVKDWNERSLRLVERLGFARTGSHPVGDERYVVLERRVPRTPVRPR
jgi:RimJ/RimL family protein N-acetyltransferase